MLGSPALLRWPAAGQQPFPPSPRTAKRSSPSTSPLALPFRQEERPPWPGPPEKAPSFRTRFLGSATACGRRRQPHSSRPARPVPLRPAERNAASALPRRKTGRRGAASWLRQPLLDGLPTTAWRKPTSLQRGRLLVWGTKGRCATDDRRLVPLRPGDRTVSSTRWRR